MINIIKENWIYFENQNKILYKKIFAENIINKLNQEKLIVITWLNWIWKSEIISSIVLGTNFKNSYLYFNKNLDLENKIKTEKELILLTHTYTKNYKIPKLIILENISNIEWIKSFISFLYKENYKVIIIWNNIKISSKPEFEIFFPEINKDQDIDSLYNQNYIKILKYWLISEIQNIEDIKLKEKFLELKKSEVIFSDIIKIFWIKNFSLYINLITFLSSYNKLWSLREIHKNIQEMQKISIKTLNEYIEFSIESKIIKKVYNFDFKKNKEIKSKAKFYFTDNWIRNCLQNFSLEENILEENLVFLELEKRWYKINSWTNWKFHFNFLAEKTKILGNWDYTKTLFIHFSENSSKDEIKKELKKLLKVPELPKALNSSTSEEQSNSKQDFKKYLIVNNHKQLKFKKLQYENLHIITTKDLLKIL